MNNGEDWTERTYGEAERAIGYAFKDRNLLKTCFTHKTYANVCGGEHNERLEFLGDAVLQLCVTEKLFGDCKCDEGKLTELRKQYVSKPALDLAERKAGLMRFLRYSGGERNVSGKTPSNLFEAVVAGIYLDGGAEEAKRFLARYLTEIETENYKTMLQEFVQDRTKSVPEYRVDFEDGTYRCRVCALGESAEGAGESKKTAETEAAKTLYLKLTKRKNK